MVLGAILAMMLFPEFSVYEGAILGVMLAATDAALGKAVVTNQGVPARLRDRLSAESGLNDGLAVLFLLLFIALEQGAAVRGEGVALELLAEEVGIGFAVGVVLSLIAAKVARFATEADWLAHVWQSMTVPALAILIFAVAQGLHGSGYIAAFVGGLCFRAAMKEDVHEMLLPAEGAGEVRPMTAWVLFAMMLLPAALPHIGWSEVIYAVLSLTIIRVMPVILSLAGKGEPMASKAFVAWFGPRGLASLAFATIVWSEQIPEAGTVVAVTILTVGISLVAHGVTARPFASRLAGHVNS
jgi:NhaP-type Na+/H+ or K+/H+ antiporter